MRRQEFTYIDFEIESENWNVYQLSDGSKLFSRVIVIQIIKTSHYDVLGKPQYGILSSTINSVRAIDDLRGKPAHPLPTPQQLGEAIVEKVTAKAIGEEHHYMYKCEDGSRFAIRNLFTSISRTSYSDTFGEPIYMIQNQIAISEDIPKNLWKTK